MFIPFLLFVIFGPALMSSSLYPPVLLCVLAWYSAKWLWARTPDVRAHRGPADERQTTEPVTKEELKAWLFRNTHHRLPAEEQSLEYYQDLYGRSRPPASPQPSASQPTPKVAAARPTAPKFVAASGQGWAELPPVDWATHLAIAIGGASLGSVSATVALT